MSLSKQLTADSSHREKGGNKEREKDKQLGYTTERNKKEKKVRKKGKTKEESLCFCLCVCWKKKNSVIKPISLNDIFHFSEKTVFVFVG